MQECKSFRSADALQTLVHCFNSGIFLDWLEAVTGKTKIISDPHLIGAGLSVTTQGSSLKLHTDFNWNDEIALNRIMSLILYTNPEWQSQWGGHLEFWSLDRDRCLQKISPRPNRLIIWHYDERLWHGYPDPLQCPQDQARVALRVFYYQSNATPLTPPHRSLYWYDAETGHAKDDRTHQ
jgi:Rps23 Pro-64 3,4-dihydroxylase Tpa1-like proline 4-hydroxylase